MTTSNLEPRQLTPEEAEDFVRRLVPAYRSSDPEQWADLYAQRFDGIQPLMPDLYGKADGLPRIRRMFRAFPDLKIEVRRWAVADEFLYVELTTSGTIGGRPLTFASIDRFRLRDGLVVERVSYYDGLGILLKFLKRPRGWPALLRARFFPQPSLRDPITEFIERHP
jgi:hypothetical protein